MKRAVVQALPPLALLALSVWAQIGFLSAPVSDQADVWNGSQAMLCAVLWMLVWNAYRDTPGAVEVCALGVIWQILTVGFSVAWLIHPWEVVPNQPQGSALLRMPLAAISALAALWIALRIWKAEQQQGKAAHDHAK